MGYDNHRIKSNARIFYRNNQVNSILAVLISFGIGAGASVCVNVNIPERISGLFDSVLLYIACAAVLLDAVIAIATIPFYFGYMNWYRRSIFQNVSLGDMFEFYRSDTIWSCIGTGLLMCLYITLWSLLFCIPGIIKTYSYWQTIFIKAENPNIPPSRAIKLSMIMMNGHKWDLFCLHFSFIGWNILSALTMNILGIIFVIPYYQAAMAFAYEEIKADAVARGVIDIMEINPNYEMKEMYPDT